MVATIMTQRQARGGGSLQRIAFELEIKGLGTFTSGKQNPQYAAMNPAATIIAVSRG